MKLLALILFLIAYISAGMVEIDYGGKDKLEVDQSTSLKDALSKLESKCHTLVAHGDSMSHESYEALGKCLNLGEYWSLNMRTVQQARESDCFSKLEDLAKDTYKACVKRREEHKSAAQSTASESDLSLSMGALLPMAEEDQKQAKKAIRQVVKEGGGAIILVFVLLIVFVVSVITGCFCCCCCCLCYPCRHFREKRDAAASKVEEGGIVVERRSPNPADTSVRVHLK